MQDSTTVRLATVKVTQLLLDNMWATCINAQPEPPGKCNRCGAYHVVAVALLTPAAVSLSHVCPHHLVQLATV